MSQPVNKIDPLHFNHQPPRGVCQSAQALEAKPIPCLNCAKRPHCLTYNELGNIQHSSGWNVTLAVTGCFSTGTKSADPVVSHGEISAELQALGVKDLCFTCGAQDCSARDRRSELVSLSARGGLHVRVMTICCSAVSGAARSELGRLHQIQEPTVIHHETLP